VSHTATAPTPSYHPAPTYPTFDDALPVRQTEGGPYRVRFARSAGELDQILRLRFEVFNRELKEGLESSYATGRDEDEHDSFCHHLLVEHRPSGRIIGTYRLQSPAMAAAGAGLYTASEFDLSALPPEVLGQAVEVGRACIAREHRGRQVLYLLWRGLAQYLAHNGLRYLFGCCSLTGQDPAEGLRALELLRRRGAIDESLPIRPLPDFCCQARCQARCPADGGEAGEETEVSLTPLFEIYLRYGGRVLSPPALDRRFGTIDFLVLLDSHALDPRSRRLFFGESAA
jgi:putative hemolysin